MSDLFVMAEWHAAERKPGVAVTVWAPTSPQAYLQGEART